MIIGAEIILKLAMIIALGGLVGFEREHRHKEAGVRTFILIAFAGFLSAFLSTVFGNWVFLIVLIGALVLASLSYHDNIYKKSHIGLTTVFAMVIMFFTGVIGYLDSYPPFLTVTVGIILALVLASREYLHKFAYKLKQYEILDGVIFGLLAFVILPLLPKQALDPWGVFRPFYVWLFMVIVLGINFASYAVMKIFGPRLGLELTGILGGLVSSTSVTASMATKIAKNKSLLSVGSFASTIASSILFLRVPVVIFFLAPKIGLALLVPMLIIGLIGIVTSFMLLKNGKTRVSPEIGSPLELKTALRFGMAFVFVLVIINLIDLYFGQAGIFVTSFISGLTDVDAISLSLATVSSVVGVKTVIVSILIATLANTMFKWGITRQVAGKEMFIYVAKSFLPMIIACIIMILMVYFGALPLIGNL